MAGNSLGRQQGDLRGLSWFGRNGWSICGSAVWLALLLAVPGLTGSEHAELSPQPGVLIMRSGHVLQGDIIRVGNRYVLTTGQGDELRVPVDRVEFRCPSMEAAFQRKKEALPASRSAAEHLELGSWCLHYGLLSAAAEQLMEAENLSPGAPENLRFEKRLRLAAHASADQSEPISAPATQVRSSDLDQVTNDLPAAAVRQFTAAIQPLLMNRCSANACHGDKSTNSFRLIRPLAGRTIPRHFTQRNLQSVLSKIDRAEPWKSPLLVLPTVSKPNQGGHIRVFSRGEFDQLQLLASWVDQVTGDSGNAGSAREPSTTASSSSHGGQPVLDGADSPNAAAQTPPRSAMRTAVQPRQPTPAARLPQDEPTAVQDPFDPEIFNRRYLKR